MPQSMQLWLKLWLLSDATLGRGDGVAGVVDAEVQHDELGLPYLSGKTLKGLLGAECAEILFALQLSQPDKAGIWSAAADRLFGEPGSQYEAGTLHVSDARLPRGLRAALAADFARIEAELREQYKDEPDAYRQQWERRLGRFQRENLEALTALRRQTALDAATGAPRENTLRTMRVVVRETPLEAEIIARETLSDAEQQLLAACVRAFRRAGTGRNRGRGRLRAELYLNDPSEADTQPITGEWFVSFRKAVL